MEQGFPTPLAAKLARVSTKTLENWDRRGFLKPSIAGPGGHGVARVYSFRDLVAIRVANELRRAGISVKSLRRVVDYLRARKGLTSTEVLASTMLVSDGHDVYELTGDMRISALRSPEQTVMLVPLGQLVSEIQAGARKAHAA